MSDKPTGVFVRLPLSETDARKIRSAIDTPSYEPESLSAELLAIGTPVTGGDVQVVGWCHQVQLADLHKDNGSPDRERFVVMSRTQFVSRDVPLVRQSDAQAQIAALEAEVVQLREALRLLLADWEDCMGRERPSIGSNAAREALKGGAA